jgi:hypothetical protein
MNEARHPQCFVSYAWESGEHKAWVRFLATRLRGKGVNALLDQWDLHPGANLTAYMERSIEESDYVLIICTPTYVEKASQERGGVGYEKTVITGQMFVSALSEAKFIPILRAGSPSEALPGFLKSRLFLDFRKDTEFESRFEELLRHVYNSPRYPPPPLGDRPYLVPEPNQGLREIEVVERHTRAMIPEYLLRELELNWADRKEGLTSGQKAILNFIEGESVRRSIPQQDLEKEFRNRRGSIYWRLEYLCLLGFIEKEIVGFRRGYPTYIYRLSNDYRSWLSRSLGRTS